MRIARAALLAALTLAVAGCGTDEQAATGGAELVPKTVPAFVAIDSDVDSAQWKQVETLLKKFPDGQRAIDMAKGSFDEETKLDWERDVKPALGDEIDLVWLDFAGDGENLVAITQPKDEQKFRELIAKANAGDDSGEDVLVGEQEGWLVLSDSQAKIDRFKEQAEKESALADDGDYEDAVAELPDARLVTVFARGDDLVRAIGRESGIAGGSLLFGQAKPEQLSASLSAEDGGFKFVGASQGSEAAPAESYTSKLIEEAPGDAVAFASFRGGNGLREQVRKLEGEPSFQEGLRELEQELGIRLDRLLELFENEAALYVRPGTPFPEVTLLLEAPETKAALDAVNDVLEGSTKQIPAQPCHSPEGVGITCVSFGQVEVRSGVVRDMVVVTTGIDAILDLRTKGPGSELSESDAFKSAKDAAGLPDETAGFLWVDIEKVEPMVLGLAAAGGEDIPPEVRRNLEPLQALVAWATADGTKSSSELFLEID